MRDQRDRCGRSTGKMFKKLKQKLAEESDGDLSPARSRPQHGNETNVRGISGFSEVFKRSSSYVCFSSDKFLR